MPDETLRILLVEDNPGDARLVDAVLESAKDGAFRVEHAKRLDEAVSLLAGDKFDAVLLDLSLPDSSGMDTIDVAKVSNSSDRTPIIVVTGRYTESDALETIKHGAEDFLLKNNLRTEALVRSIRYAVEREHRRLKAKAGDDTRRQAREIEALEHMSAPASTLVTARADGMERLAESAADAFEALVEQYCELIEQAIEQRTFRMDSKTTQGVRVLAQRLGFLRASPRDVMELHLKALQQMRPPKMTTSYVLAEEARLLVLELMGHLTAYYRDHMMPIDKPRSLSRP